MKKEIDFGLSFHQTFPPNPAYIGRILNIAKGEKISPREISELTGIPQGESSGKVVPHLKYAVYMGFIEPDISCPQLTPLGKVVLDEDSSCSEEITQWLMHANLTSSNGAPMWNFLVRTLLHHNHEGVSKEYLASEMQFKFGNAKYAQVLTTYNELSSINYLKVDRANGKVEVYPQRIHHEYLYMYGYELLREWDVVYPSQLEITADEMNALACSTCMGLTDIQWFEVMEQLAVHGICRINRQLTPFTVIRTADVQSLIDKIYSLLI